MEPILTLRDVGFRYGLHWAVRGVDMEIRSGEILGVLGPNGSGKTTLLKIMDGMLHPQEGQVHMGGESILSLTRARIARKIAMVAQETHFRFAFSALEVVLMGRFPHLGRLQFEGKKDVEAAYQALNVTHALELADRSIHELSGGEKQRVLIARALVQEPKMILFDEPTAFLDLRFKREVFQLIASLSLDRGLAIVVVSHDIDLAAQYSHRVIMLKQGSVYAAGDPESVVTEKNIEAVYDCPVLVDHNPATGKPRVSLPP